MNVTIFSNNTHLKKDIEAYTHGMQISQNCDTLSIFQEILFKKPDLLIIDSTQENILDLYSKMKNENNLEDLHILFLMDNFKQSFFQKLGFNIGEVDYLTKPIEINQLISKLNFHNTLHKMTKKLISIEDFITQYSQSVIKGEMLGIISHQWKQPLNIIATSIINIELKSELEQLEHCDIEKSVNKIHTTLDKITKMIHSFEDIFENNLSKTNFNTNEAFLKSVELMSPQLNSRKIKISNNIPKKVIITSNFENELCQSILCLLSIIQDSIIKKHKEKNTFYGNIKLHLQKEADKIVIKIINYKIEMSQDEFNSSMSLNPLLSSTNNDNTKLYIAKKIIENKLNGNLSIINDKKDVIFNITL
ncbi:MAG: HAMP domain-containing histidine kinase [Campylobacteraceae bacterium]|nr:HAMP domain-containing histidine kinase [Campylobacteraceae bacterium]